MEGVLKKKICQPGMILNKETGRCVKKSGGKGRTLVKTVMFDLPKRKSPQKKYC